jgi:cysteine desulfurase/selenocysteine lyase
MLDLTTKRQDFSILSNSASSKQVYFDNACMSLKPHQVINAITEYYTDYPAGAGFTNVFQRATDSSGTGATVIGTHSNATHVDQALAILQQCVLC